ncbi:helix-turn-helix domain-containing protein [Lentzea chajnantorensis]
MPGEQDGSDRLGRASLNEAQKFGKRVRELRNVRGLTLREAGPLAGMDHSNLAKIERGEVNVSSRTVLEAIATALQVAPHDLLEQPLTLKNPVAADAHAVIVDVEDALGEIELGERPEGVVPRPVDQVLADVDHLNRVLRPKTDYAAQGAVVPGLMRELYALFADEPSREVLQAQLEVMHTAAVLCKNLGVRGLPTLAAHHARKVAEELGDPAWLALAAWLRGHAAGSAGRSRQYKLSVDAADQLTGHLDDPNAQQMFGMLHLNAALAAAAGHAPDPERAREHLAEAEAIAQRMDVEVGEFGNLYFGRPNVGVWRVTLAAELGEGAGRVAELAQDVHPELIPSAARVAMYQADLGRSLIAEKKFRLDGVQALVRAESIAPQRMHHHVLFRQAVAGNLKWANRNTVEGRELRRLAYVIGMAAPTG